MRRVRPSPLPKSEPFEPVEPADPVVFHLPRRLAQAVALLPDRHSLVARLLAHALRRNAD